MLLPITIILVLLSNVNFSNAFGLNEPSIEHPIILPRYPIKRRAAKSDYVAYAVAASNQMMTWYNSGTGLWDGAWWNSANVITTLADFQERFPAEIAHITSHVFPTTLEMAPKAFGFTGFINDYYDDELWWVLAWIKVFDVTGERKYLDKAAEIFEDSKNSFGTSSCKALWYVPT